MILETIVVGAIETNCYVVAAGKNREALVIDPGADAGQIKKALSRHSCTAGLVVNTHGHYDHIGADGDFGVPVAVHRSDADMLYDGRKNYSAIFGISFKVKNPVRYVEDGELLEVGGVSLRVLHTPGHSPGGISLLLEKPQSGIVFTGDALFAGSIGRTDLGGSQEALLRSIREKLLVLPDETVVYPGHGPSTTIGQERRGNPFLS
ncbi:MAG TPA: MBL fold metallo-hydrolase [Candidatus Omnitrophota bacterium]|nr:MBL fold metallo-hydrolase [Candidatus Omnitrophota bacterium]HQJ15625.1 MBL fold metallo-hydrolase [Candidatus Omnitrophota bacterium]